MFIAPSLASAPARSTIRAKPAVLKGAPRSEVKTNGDLALIALGIWDNHVFGTLHMLYAALRASRSGRSIVITVAGSRSISIK